MRRDKTASVSAWRILKAAYQARSANHGQRMGAALAYYTLFSMAPLLLIVIAITGVILGHGPAQMMVLGSVERHFGSESAQTIRQLIERAATLGNNRFASVFGFVALILGALGVVGELQASLNLIWKVPTRPSTLGAFLRTRLVSLTLIFAIGFLLFVSLALNVLATVVGHSLGGLLPFPEIVLQLLNIGVSFLVITLAFAFIYKLLPEARVAWRDVWTGAAATSLLFTLGSFFLGLYLGKIGVTSAYGAAGSLVAIVAWAYYCAQILYFGAELTYAYAEANQPPGFSSGVKGFEPVVHSRDGLLNFITTLFK